MPNRATDPIISGMGFVGPDIVGTDELARRLEESESLQLVDAEEPVPSMAESGFRDSIEKLCASSEAAGRAACTGRRLSTPLRATLVAALEAWGTVELNTKLDRVGCIVAANNHQDSTLEALIRQDAVSPQIVTPGRRLSRLDPWILGLLSRALGFRGYGSVIGTQSAASNSAVAVAVAMIRAGLLDYCLVVAPAFEPSESFLAMCSNLGILSRVTDSGPIRPFDNSHAGTVPVPLAAAVMISNPAMEPRGGIRLSGVGGCQHPTTGAEPDLEAEIITMKLALADAGIGPEDIDYVNAHATGTPQGDSCEASALRNLFGRRQMPPVINATKALLGHGFNAAGLVGIVASALQINNGFLHSTPGLTSPIEEFSWAPKSTVRHGVVSHALCNTFAFFGVNASVVLSAPDTTENGYVS